MKKTGSFSWSVFFCLMLSLLGHIALAEVKVQATVDRNQINMGDTFILTVSVSSDKSVNITQPRLPSLKAFQLMQNWTGTEARSTFSNGKFQTTRTRKFNYQLTSSVLGSNRIGPVEVVVSGKSYRTKIIDIKVLQSGAPTPKKRNRFGQNPFGNRQSDPFAEVDDIFNQLLGRRGGNRQAPQGTPQAQIDVDTSDAVSIEVVIDKDQAYAGEQVTATWYLYTRAQIRDIDTLKYPSLNGFWKEDIEVARQLNFRNEIVNGVIYRKALLASYALFPLKPGAATVDAYQAKLTTLLSNQGFGFGRPVVLTKESKTRKIKVLELPEGAPTDFTGAVGSFTARASLDLNHSKVNQPVTLKLRFDGRGNGKLIELPELKLPDGLEVYDTKSEAKYYKNGKSYKQFEVLLIPRKSGSYTIPELSFSIFDPNTKQYVSTRTNAISLQIDPGDPSDETIPSSSGLAEKKKEAEPEKKVEVLQPALKWSSYSSSSLPWPWIILGLNLLSLIVLLLKARSAFAWGQKKIDLVGLVKKRFQSVHSLLRGEKWRDVGSQSINTIYLILGDVSGDGASHQIDKLLLKIPPSLRREVGDDLEKLMSKFQALAFAPEEMLSGISNKDQVKKDIKELEKIALKIARLRSNTED